MKFLFENWKRYLKEGNVVRGPWAGTPSPIQFDFDGLVDELEEIIGSRLEDLHGQSPIDIPPEKLEHLGHIKEVVKNRLRDELVKLFDPEYEYRGDD
jgi:hypothetical protein